MARAHRLGGQGVLPLPMERLRELAAPNGGAHRLGGQGVLPRRWSLPTERQRGMVAPNGADPLAAGDGESCPSGGRCLWSTCGGWPPQMAWTHWLRGTGSPAHVVVAAYGAPTRASSPQRCEPTGRGEKESCLGGCRCLRSAYGG